MIGLASIWLAPRVIDALPGGDAFAPSRTGDTSASSSTSPPVTTRTMSTPTTAATTTTSELTALQLRVVPAVRDVEVSVDDERFTSDANGLIVIPATGPKTVTVLGYFVSPSFQRVTFAAWGDGSTAPTRTFDPTGTAAVIDLGVEISYRITVVGPSASPVEQVVLTHGDEKVTVAVGTPKELVSVRAVRGTGDRLRAEPVTYRLELDGRPQGDLTPTPEGQFELP